MVVSAALAERNERKAMKHDPTPSPGSLDEARKQVHDSIQAQHPAWRDRHGECAPCARFEQELAAQTAGQPGFINPKPHSNQ